MGAFFTAILGKLVAAVAWIGELFKQVFVSLWELVTDAACWVFDGVLGVAVSAANSFDTSGITASVGVWGELSAEALNVLQLLGVGTAITIITTAILIRFGLQLIPFVRLGS